jgi:hypothetical protein
MLTILHYELQLEISYGWVGGVIHELQLQLAL